jgi:lambda family phage minor tail protein L|nr:MAG TPA: minor tail protein L [Caudoviricetes sp.]
MATIIPDTHKIENLKLEADAYVDLFQIDLYNKTTLRLKAGDDIEWAGYLWEGYPIELSGHELDSEKLSRPTLRVVNPEGIFSSLFISGDIEKATLYRYRVLRQDLDNNREIYQRLKWIIWNVKSITKNYVELELRNPMDGNNFNVPARLFIQPDFPSVTLG